MFFTDYYGIPWPCHLQEDMSQTNKSKDRQISWTPRTEVQLSQAGRDGAWLPAAPGGQAGDSLGSEDAKDEATRGRWGSKKGTDMRKGWARVYYFLVIDLGVS
jgi:hypothetical protein